MCFKAENVFLQLFKKKTVIKKKHCQNFNLKPYFLNIYASTHNILLSENLAVGELFIGKPPVDERHSNNDFFSPNRTLSARRLIVERKMTPILSKSLESESAACVPPQSWPAVAQSYLAPPQTASDAFLCGLQKRRESLKLHPRLAAGISRSGAKMGCGKRRLTKCVNSILTCLRLNFNLFEGGGGVEGRLEMGGGRGNEKAQHCNKSPLSLTPQDSAVPGIQGSTGNSVYISQGMKTLFTLELRQLRCNHQFQAAQTKGLTFTMASQHTDPQWKS